MTGKVFIPLAKILTYMLYHITYAKSFMSKRIHAKLPKYSFYMMSYRFFIYSNDIYENHLQF